MAQSRTVHLALILLIVAVAISHNTPRTFGSGDLIVNGGFETGNFKGWDADATCKVRPHSVTGQYYEPAHTDKYSARIGTENVKGSLSQTITIPERSKADVSFWYRVEKGSSLDFYLRGADGSTIQRWGFKEVSAWTLFKCEIGPQYAGKSIALVFEGKGFLELTYELVWVWDPSQGWIQLRQEVRHYYWPYIDDVSAFPAIAVYSVTVSISGLPSSLSTSIFVDGREEYLRGEDSKTFQFTFGERHEFKAKDYVYDGEEVRYVCKSNVQTSSSDATVTFDYTPQYRLTAESPYGQAEGSGWFDKGDIARFSVSPTTISMEGFLGFLGAKHVFKSWMGGVSESSPSAETKMDSPKRVTAVWETDYSSVYMILGGLGAAITGLSFVVFLKMRGVKEKREAVEEVETKGKEVETAAAQTLVLMCPRCNVENPAGSKFCRNCGGKLVEYEIPTRCPHCNVEIETIPYSRKLKELRCSECGGIILLKPRKDEVSL